MNNLLLTISPEQLKEVHRLCGLRFADSNSFSGSDIYVAYEQGFIPEDKARRLLADVYKRQGVELERLHQGYIPKEIIHAFRGYNAVPLKIDSRNSILHVGCLPEFLQEDIRYDKLHVQKHPVSMIDYVRDYYNLFGQPSFMLDIPAKDTLDMIIQEAIAKKASDITISQKAACGDVYYNIAKRKIMSQRVVSKEVVDEMIHILAMDAGATILDDVREPRYFGVDLTPGYRGRNVVNRMIYGLSCTTRVLENDFFNKTLESLNLSPTTIQFLRRHFVESTEAGLRLLVGPTMSGKNTTIMSVLYELMSPGYLKGISVEMPVEILTDFLEQRDCATEAEYIAAVDALRRENPDIVYITEFMDEVALPALKVSNTGKKVFSSLHANSLAETLSRMQDMTGLSLDRLVLNLHSMVYQTLERVETPVGATMRPKNRCIYFDDELKKKLMGKTLGESYLILKEVEDKWI